jgi:hypothetical protein
MVKIVNGMVYGYSRSFKSIQLRKRGAQGTAKRKILQLQIRTATVAPWKSIAVYLQIFFHALSVSSQVPKSFISGFIFFNA